MAGRTTLMIAHRLSTIRNAHQIVVLQDEGIAEQGNHEELMAINGIYRHLNLVQAQLHSKESMLEQQLDRAPAAPSAPSLPVLV